MKTVFSAGVMLFASLNPALLPAQRTITIDPTAPRQTWEGWGTSLAWFANGAGGWSEANRLKLSSALFDKKMGLGLTYVRYNIGGGDRPGYGKPIKLAPNAVPGYQPEPGVFDWSRDANQRWFLLKAQSLGANLFEAVSYSPPYWMTVSGTSQGAVDGGSNLQSKYFGSGKGSFADYLTTVVQHYSDQWGVTFRNLEPVNEPAPSWWKAGDQKQEGCHFSEEEQDAILRDAGASLASKGLITTVAAADENNIDVAIQEFVHYSAEAKAQITQLNVHSYAGAKRALLESVAATNGKRLAMSEWGSSDSSGKDIATQIQADIVDMGAVNWSIWQPDWPGLMRIDYAKEAFRLTPAYYVYGNYSRFIHPGYQFLHSSDPSTLSAYDAKSKTLVIVEQNWTTSNVDLTYNLSGFDMERSTVAAYRASAPGLLLPLDPRPIARPGFNATAPAQSVTTYIVSGVSVYAPGQTIHDTQPGLAGHRFRYSGSWKHNRGQSSTEAHKRHGGGLQDDSYTVSFTGIQARAYASFTRDAGIAAFSVDSGAETAIDLYAAKPVEDAMAFSTPLLPAGNHTLKVRVTGLKNAASTGTVLTARRMDVIALPTRLNDGATGSSANQFNFIGSWAYDKAVPDAYSHDIHASSSADDSYTVLFSGSAARVYLSSAPDSGIAAFSVDGGLETNVDLYAAKRSSDVFVYATPVLPVALHTLKVRVTGRRNAASSGSSVTADRVDVTP